MVTETTIDRLPPHATSKLTLAWLCSSYGLAILPLYSELSPLIYAIALLAIGWRYLTLLGKVRLLTPWQLKATALLGCVLIAVLALQQGILGSILNLLVLGCALKFLEFRQRRDLRLHILALYFLGGITFVFHQQWYFLLYLLLSVTLNTAALLSLQMPQRKGPQLSQAALLIGQSIPLMLVLFIVLPRVGPLWQLPNTKRATTGLSEQISPEQISELTRSSELVFRAHFPSEPPAVRYWRTLVHESFDGHSWSMSPQLQQWQRSRLQLPFPEPQVQWPGPKLDYQLYVEPNYHHWVYSLDLSSSPDPTLSLTPTLTQISLNPLTQSRQFTLSYYPEQNKEPRLSEARRRFNLALPPSGNPRSRQLAQQWKEQYADPQQLIQVAMNYFREQPFYYTLRPPPLSTEGIDDFLFTTRAGFCAHYASSLAFLLRSAGIPTRLVTGYLGGEYHATEGYVSVHQFDAHAWVEAWLPGGWQRLDPTLMVAPDRVTMGLDELMRDQGFLAQDPLSLARYRQIPLLNDLRLLLADLDYQWTVWILNYNSSAQQDLLKRWLADGLGGRIALMVGGSLLAILIACGIGWLYRPRQRRDPLLQLYQQACQRLARSGWPRQVNETPLQYVARLARYGHPAAATMRQLTLRYLQLRYSANRSSLADWQRLRQLLRRIKSQPFAPNHTTNLD